MAPRRNATTHPRALAPAAAGIRQNPFAPVAAGIRINRRPVRAKPKLNPRNAVAALAMTNRDAVTLPERLSGIVTSLTDGKPQPALNTFTITSLLDRFIQGKLNLEPSGQRPIVYTFEMARRLTSDICWTVMRPPTLLINNRDGDVWDVHDGKQRISVILCSLLGIRGVENPYRMTEGERQSLFITNPNDPDFGYLSLLASETTHTSVKNFINVNLTHLPAEPFNEELDSEVSRSVFGNYLSVQLYSLTLADWPSEAAACYALLQEVNSMHQSPGEIFYMSPNKLSDAVRGHEMDVVSMLKELNANVCDTSKEVFLCMVRGFACGLDLQSVPKASNDRGHGGLLIAIYRYMFEELPTGAAEQLNLACTDRLREFVDTYLEMVKESQDCQIKTWKPDMISALMFLLMADMEVSQTLTALVKLSRPSAHEQLTEWYRASWIRKTDLRECLRRLVAVFETE